MWSFQIVRNSATSTDHMKILGDIRAFASQGLRVEEKWKGKEKKSNSL